MKKATKYTVFNDPGHGWVKVRKAEIERLGILNEISSCSYELGEFAYLEEDCDAGVFFEAKTKAGENFQLAEKYCNGMSAIRKYRYYRKQPVGKKATVGDIVEVVGSKAVPALKLTSTKPLRGNDQMGNSYRLPRNMMGVVLGDWP